MTLLTGMDSNPKTAKLLEELSIEGVILHFLAADQAHTALGLVRGTLCPMALRNGCAKACLVNQGRGRMRSVFAGRLRRTKLYLTDRAECMRQLRSELTLLQRRAAKKGRRAVARLDGTSDLGLALTLAPEFPEIQFYDYTKVYRRALRVHEAHGRGELANYHVTFSRGAGNEAEALDCLARGINVTVVFRSPSRAKLPLPATWRGFEVIDGDAHDYRFLDRPGVVVGLRAKGSAIHDATGFVAEVE